MNTYSGAHRNLTLRRGLASEYVCGCGKPAREWAYDHQDPGERIGRGLKYSLDPERYKPMCRRCHRLFDKAAITHCPKGHAYEGPNLIWDAGKRKCRTCVYARNTARRRARAAA